MAKRILVVDDDHQIVRLARSFLEQAGFSVFVAFDGEQAMHIVRGERPDLIVLDLMLPDPDGWEITRRIRADKKLYTIPILMLTARVEDADKIAGLQLGADDYLTKPFNGGELVARVNAIMRRVAGLLTPSNILECGDLRVDLDQGIASMRNQPLALSPSEFAILSTLMKRPNHVLSRAELIEKALGYAYEGLDRTLDSHIRNLRKKLNHEDYIETVIGVGYRLREKPAKLEKTGE
jgi:two-component system alkaline phosphatase synthesis response regulator PhoP